ncbi:winged helix-turn-helix domain-containing protein [Streptomyces sp. NPDC059193]
MDLARVAELIHVLFGYQYTPRGVWYLPHRLGCRRRCLRTRRSSGRNRS